MRTQSSYHFTPATAAVIFTERLKTVRGFFKHHMHNPHSRPYGPEVNSIVKLLNIALEYLAPSASSFLFCGSLLCDPFYCLFLLKAFLRLKFPRQRSATAAVCERVWCGQRRTRRVGAIRRDQVPTRSCPKSSRDALP